MRLHYLLVFICILISEGAYPSEICQRYFQISEVSLSEYMSNYIEDLSVKYHTRFVKKLTKFESRGASRVQVEKLAENYFKSLHTGSFRRFFKGFSYYKTTEDYMKSSQFAQEVFEYLNHHGLVKDTKWSRIRFHLLKRQAPVSLALFAGSTLAVGYALHSITGVFLPIPFYVPKFVSRTYVEPTTQSRVVRRYAEKLAVSFMVAYYASSLIHLPEYWSMAESMYNTYREVVEMQEAAKSVAESLYNYEHIHTDINEVLKASEDFRRRYEQELNSQSVQHVP